MKISEKMLEDWICENPKVLGDKVIIIGRQVVLRHGILDLLAWDDALKSILIIELKVTPIKEKHIGQLLRYVHDIDDVLSNFWQAMIEPRQKRDGTIRQELFDIAVNDYLLGSDENKFFCPVSSILIGTNIDKHTYVAACGGGISVRLWDYQDGILHISNRIIRDTMGRELDTPPEWTFRLWPYIRRVCSQFAEYKFDKGIEKLLQED